MRIGVDGVDRRSEVDDVEPALEVARQFRLDELYDDSRTLPADIDACVRVGKIDFDPGFPVLAAMEVDVADGVDLISGLGCCEKRARTGFRACVDRMERDEQIVAIDLRLVSDRAQEIHHQSGALTGLHDVDAGQGALADFDGIFVEGAGSVLEIKGDAGGVADRKR